jgi:hypothetical protein
LVGFIVIVSVAIGQLNEAKQLRIGSMRPYLIVDVDFENLLVVLSIRNTGGTAASSVLVRFDQRLRSSAPDLKLDWQDSTFFTTGMAMMAPGRELRYVIDRYPDRVGSGLPMMIKGVATYVGHSDKRSYRESFAIDLTNYSGSLIDKKGVPELIDSVDSLRDSLVNVADSAGQSYLVRPEWEESQVVGIRLPAIAMDLDRHDDLSARSRRAVNTFGRVLRRMSSKAPDE